MARRTAEDAEKTRASIVDAALEVFAAEGVRSARLEEIARRAGVTRGALYHHFAGKPELLAAIFRERWEDRTRDLLAPLQGPRRGTAVREFVERYLEAVDDDDQLRALLRLSLSRDGVAPAADLSEKHGALEGWLELLDTQLRRPGASAKSARRRSESVLFALLGYSVWSSLFGVPEDHGYAARATLILDGIEGSTRKA